MIFNDRNGISVCFNLEILWSQHTKFQMEKKTQILKVKKHCIVRYIKSKFNKVVRIQN